MKKLSLVQVFSIFFLALALFFGVKLLTPKIPERLGVEIKEKVEETANISKDLCELSFEWSENPVDGDFYATLRGPYGDIGATQRLIPGKKVIFGICPLDKYVDGSFEVVIHHILKNENVENISIKVGDVLYVKYDQYFAVVITTSGGWRYISNAAFFRKGNKISAIYDGEDVRCGTSKCGPFNIKAGPEGVWVTSKASICHDYRVGCK